MDLVRLAYYPFLPQVREAIADVGPSIQELLENSRFSGARKRGFDRVSAALGRDGIVPHAILDERAAILELSSIPIARMLVVLLGDRTMARRYAHAEAALMAATLAQDPDSLPTVAEGLEVPIQDGQIHVADYVSIAPTHMDEWKLIQRPVQKGRVSLKHDDVIGLCREALEARIVAALDEELAKPPPGDLEPFLADYLAELRPALEAARENWNTGDFGPVKKGLFPPCIKELFSDMAVGKMIPHHGRFAMASFLATIGMTSNDIIDYFKEIPNFDADKSRYQIEHIAGERSVGKYTPPGCATMQSNGVCPLEKRDGLCAKIKHPLSYYRAKIRFAKQDEAAAEAANPAPEPAAPAADGTKKQPDSGGS